MQTCLGDGCYFSFWEMCRPHTSVGLVCLVSIAASQGVRTPLCASGQLVVSSWLQLPGPAAGPEEGEGGGQWGRTSVLAGGRDAVPRPGLGLLCPPGSSGQGLPLSSGCPEEGSLLLGLGVLARPLSSPPPEGPVHTRVVSLPPSAEGCLVSRGTVTCRTGGAGVSRSLWLPLPGLNQDTPAKEARQTWGPPSILPQNPVLRSLGSICWEAATPPSGCSLTPDSSPPACVSGMAASSAPAQPGLAARSQSLGARTLTDLPGRPHAWPCTWGRGGPRRLPCLGGGRPPLAQKGIFT